MIKLKFEKLYQDDRINEPCAAAIPFAKGVLKTTDCVTVLKDGNPVLTQFKNTGLWEDGTVKWLYVNFLADLPGNKACEYILDINNDNQNPTKCMAMFRDDHIVVNTGEIEFALGDNIFEYVKHNGFTYDRKSFSGPILKDGNGNVYKFSTNNWRIMDNGPVCVVVRGEGVHIAPDNAKLKCDVKITAFTGKPWIEFSYRIYNTTYEDLHLADLTFKINMMKANTARTLVADSNYATHYDISEKGARVERLINSDRLKYAGNEHMGEVFYGTLFADCTNSNGGICATIYQAHQNYPKAVSAHNEGVDICLVPPCDDQVVMHSGMAREQRILLHFHAPDEAVESLNNRSTIYQMPDKPMLEPAVYRAAGVYEDVFADKKINDVEMRLSTLAEGHARCYGMLNWGDSPDPGYSSQGRGQGKSVWTNNEYDFSHANTLQYIRTGYRRYLDTMLVSSSHWMDVDVCHFSDDPLTYQGQWEHSSEHCVGSHMACSHEWVAGLLDYYHFTGDEHALQVAMGIGHNVLRILESPEFSAYGALHARETGWALRTFVDMYNQTNGEKWLDKCEWIVGHFEQWKEKYNGWLAPYTDNTVIRVVFMISIAITSLMRYYRIRPSDRIKEMILYGVNDLVENCIMDNGLFYYKELPSLQRPGGTNVLEALAIAFEITGDKKYLEAGLETFKRFMSEPLRADDFTKRVEGDAVINAGTGTKPFAQSFLPVVSYYKAASEQGLL